jgi:ABC-type uncharacterized transport system auxiliary subunit
MTMTCRHARSFAIILFLLFTSGCALRSPAPPPTTYYHLSYPAPSENSKISTLPLVVRVEPFEASALYGSQRIVFHKGEHESGRYVYHQWVSPPPQMISQLIARDFRHAELFQGVYWNGSEPVSHRLTGQIEALHETQQSGEGKGAVVSLAVTLVNAQNLDPASAIRLQKTYTFRKPSPSADPTGFVRAASRALADISEQLRRDLRNVLQ